MGKVALEPMENEPTVRPGTIILTLVLMGISTLFAGLCAAYLYTLISTRIEAPQPPVLFFINIPVLLFATLFLKNAFAHIDDEKAIMKKLLLCLTLSLVFVTLQILGWQEFFKQIPLNGSQARSFLFVLSALHLLHVLAGIPFLMRFILMNRGILNTLRFSTNYRLRFLKGLVRYWNYLDILWILLVAILSLGFMMKWI